MSTYGSGVYGAGLYGSGVGMAYADEVLADSPMFYWALDEASGTVAHDASPNGADGTITGTGVTYSVPGIGASGGTALTFDGTSGAIASAAPLTPGGSVVTFECWASFPAFTSNDNLLAEFSTNYNSFNGAFMLDPNSAASGKFDVGIRSAGTSTVRSFERPTAGEAHHLVVVIDVTNATTVVKVYVDNTAQTVTGTGNVTPGSFGSYNLYIASRAASSLFLHATADDVAFYNTELSPDRVAAHFSAASGQAPVGGFSPAIHGGRH